MSQLTAFPISLTKYPIDNEYTIMFQRASELGVPVDWLVRTGVDAYSTVVSLIYTEIEDPRHGGDIVLCLSYIYFELYEITGYVNRDIVLYGIIEYIDNEYEENERDEMIINTMRLFESYASLSQSLTVDSDIRIVRDTMERRYSLSMEETTRVMEIIANYRENCESADKLVGVINTGMYEITLNTVEIQINGVDVSSGMYLFDNILLSDRFVYVNYIDQHRKNYYKLYRGSELDREPVYSVSKLDKKRENKANRMQFGMWLGTGTIYNTTQQSFYSGVLNLETGVIRYKVPVVMRGYETGYTALSQKVIKTAFREILATTAVKIGDATTTGYTAEVNMYPNTNYSVKFDIVVFLHQIMMNDMYRHLFYMDETVRPYAKKRRMEFYYVPFLSDMFKYNEEDDRPVPVKWSVTRKTFSTEPPPETLYDDPTNVPPYFRIRLSNAKSVRDIEMIIASVSRALKMHVSVLAKDRVMTKNYYTTLFNDYNPDGSIMRDLLATIFSSKEEEENDVTKLSASNEGASRILKLSKDKVYGKVFGEGYRADCPSNNAPVVFKTLEEAEAWKRIIDWRVSPLPFPAPPAETLFWFGGPNKDFRYPNIVDNTDPTTMREYSYVPKCTAHDPAKGPKTSLYNRVYGGSTEAVTVTDVERVTDKLLDAGEEGKLPLLMSRVLDVEGQRKIGVVNASNSNSFIHCVLYAVAHREYMEKYEFAREKKSTPEALNSYVNTFRRNLVRDSNAVHLVKQELYDISDKAIVERVRDTSSFFDPFLYYRLLEEALGINILTFSNIGLEGSEDAKLEIPRHNMLHSRPQRGGRRTVIVFKNRGPIRLSKRTPYPHCELVVTRLDMTTEYSFETTDLYYYILGRVLSNVTISPALSVYNDMYSVNYEEMFGRSIMSQRIDSYGHTRAFTILQAPSTKVTLFVPPTQPLAVPVSNEVHKVSAEEAIKLVGTEPYSCSIVKIKGERYMEGLWFSYMGVDEFLYVPIMNTLEIIYEKGSGSPFIRESGRSITERIHKLSKTVDLIKQMIVWVFDTFRTRMVEYPLDETPDTVDVFVSKFFNKTSAGKKETLNFYDACAMDQRFPLVNEETECMSHIRKKCPSLVDRNLLFVFVNDAFAQKIEYFVRDYFARTFRGDFKPKEILEDYYTSYTDFKQQSHVEVFMGKGELETWMMFKESGGQERTKVLTSVSLSMHKLKEPFMFDNEGIICIIQNVDGSDEYISLKRAIGVSQTWIERGINRGYHSEPITTDPYKVNMAVYGITSGGALIVVVEPREPDEPYVSLLIYAGARDYTENRSNIRYAAILDV